jgi:hypothetical protein
MADDSSLHHPPSAIRHHLSSIIHHPSSSIIHHPSSVIHHPSFAALLQRHLQLFAAPNSWIPASANSSLPLQQLHERMPAGNRTWIVIFMVVVIAIAVMVWNSQQRIQKLNKQLDTSQAR